ATHSLHPSPTRRSSDLQLKAADMPGQTPSEIYTSAGAERSDDGEPEGTVELRMKNPDRIVHVRRVEIPGLEGEPAGILTLHEDRSEEHTSELQSPDHLV